MTNYTQHQKSADEVVADLDGQITERLARDFGNMTLWHTDAATLLRRCREMAGEISTLRAQQETDRTTIAALTFTARLSDRGEGLGERPEPARERRGDPSPALPADDWVEWKGGENPAPGKVVDVKYRNGVADNYVNSTEVDWPHASSVIGITGYDIIAYRIPPSTPSDTGKASG